MSILISFLLLLFTTIVQSQNLKDNSINTGIGTCSCDLKKGSCDVSCCCDTDCSTEDLKIYNCDSTTNKDINSISSKPLLQSTCFKDISLYKSNSPYIEEKDNLVCVKNEIDIDANNAYYEQLINQTINSKAFQRSINIDSGVSFPLVTSINLTTYQVGSSIFRYILETNTATYYSLPIKLFNGATCSGLQPITYMNDFTSTCNQPVNEQTCLTTLDTTKYLNPFYLAQNARTLALTTPIYIGCSVSASSSSPSSWASSTCSNALQILTMTIYYDNSIGIVNCSISLNNSISGALNNSILQTFTVRFVQSGQSGSSSTTTSRSGNPGYLKGAPIIAGISNGNSITTSDFTILQASTTGICSTTVTDRKLIRFNQNIQAICLFSATASGNCPKIDDVSNIFMSFNTSNLFVANNGNPDPTNISSHWLPVTFCTSEIGSSNEPECQVGSVPSSSTGCYIRLDIQIAYANIGSVTNPQPYLGAVAFHYQRVINTSTTPLTTPLLITQTVTFQDISSAPVTEGDQIPRPNTRILGDFFYPFSLNRATNSIAFSPCFYLLIIFFYTLM